MDRKLYLATKCPYIDWDTMYALSNEVQRTICDFCMSNSYVQCVNEPRREDHILDVVLTNEPSIVTRLSTDLSFSTSDHNTVEFDLFFKATSKTNMSQTIINYLRKKADCNALNSYLYNYRSDQLFSVNFSADNIWKAFTEVLNYAISLFVPEVATRLNGLSRQQFKRYPSLVWQLTSRKHCLWRWLRQNPSKADLRSTYKTVAIQYNRAVCDYEIRIE
jgi:hypothetical protein